MIIHFYTYIIYIIYEVKDLPYNQFEKNGMSKREVLAMPSEDLKALLIAKIQIVKLKSQIADQIAQEKLSVERFPEKQIR